MLNHRRTRAASLLASLLLHGAVLALFVVAGGGKDQSDSLLDAEPLEESKIDLGIERSRAVTMTWIGFENPTEHEAPQSVIDQAALSMTSAAASSAAPADPAPGGAPETAEPSPAGDWSALAPQIPMPVDPQQIRELMRQLLQQAALTAAASRAETADAGGEQNSEGEPATESSPTEKNADREADAVSRRRPVNVKPGQPVAAEGLEIKTTRPNWTDFMRATLRPNNPTIDITFGRNGKVRLVRFVKEDGRTLNTGSRDVDEVLVNAIYSWTAKGVAIDELDPADPEAGVTITLRILLR